MGRKPKAPCDFCEEEHYIEAESTANIRHQLIAEVYPFNGHIAVLSFAQDDCTDMQELAIEIPLNYCPQCGRKLEW